MIKRFLRVTLAALALSLAISGGLTSYAGIIEEDGGGGTPLCPYCGCDGGKTQCCSQGDIICYKK